ncbi:hypothetical protein BET10_14045 [Pseudoalteromonas amylolytica]|uniref:Uncharacterized protein n=2 Tax=Pseudoalteromonas TaxID=53246 RepID=A0A1S1MPT4_9GAMM|nr:hypothetical protein BFC16_20930 [Pseudoalteromonas sp. JW3]OHU90161.1 hypothetical protein BET10_14045 [Pseudoalteromonas amylolytica]
MIQNNWVIDGFTFSYNDKEYVVLAKLFNEGERKPKHALLKLEFIRQDEPTIRKMFLANSNGFYNISVKELREFFGIEYRENLGEIIQQFTDYFSNFIPTQVSDNKPLLVKERMVESLSVSDSEDPKRVYCFDVRRNAGQRTMFNDNKTRLLRATLYANFEEDWNLSFFYSDDNGRDATDAEILLKFANRNAPA